MAPVLKFMGAIRKKIPVQRFSLRLPAQQLEAVDAACQQRDGLVSRNTWIAEAIAEKLRRNAAPARKLGTSDA